MDANRYRKKVKHYNRPGDAHLLTFSCFRRLPLLSKDRPKLWLVRSISEARIKHEFDLWAWVFMPEHVHLLVWPRRPVYDIQEILASIKRPVGCKAIDFLSRFAPAFLQRLAVRIRGRAYHRFWQAGAGYDQNLYEPVSIHNAIQYVHHNPVRRGLVARAEDWGWSSARDWAGLGSTYLPIDRTVPVLQPSDVQK